MAGCRGGDEVPERQRARQEERTRMECIVPCL